MDTVRVYVSLALGNLTGLCGLGIHMLLSLNCSWPGGGLSGGFDRTYRDSGFSELVSLQYDREASLSSFLRSHPCLQVSHLVPCTTTHSNVLSINFPSLFYTFSFAHLIHLSYAVNAKPEAISLSQYHMPPVLPTYSHTSPPKLLIFAITYHS